MRDFASRKAIVTGGGSGIGKSIVQKFSDAGITTVTADLKETENLPGIFLPVDLTQPTQIDQFCNEVIKTIGDPGILVCNAGRGIHEKLTEGDPDTWENIYRLNVFSSFRLIRAFVPAMLENNWGDVVFISSVSANHAYEYGGIYASTKAAVDQMAETLRLEVQPAVRVTVVHPGVVDTNFFEDMIHGTQTPEDIGWGALSPDRVAESVLFAVTQPKGTALNNIVIRPAGQPM